MVPVGFARRMMLDSMICENINCRHEGIDEENRFCVHHNKVLNIFLLSGMDRETCKTIVQMDNTNTGPGFSLNDCKMCSKYGCGEITGIPKCNPRTYARALNVCNNHLTECAMRSQREKVDMDVMINTMIDEVKELDRIEKERRSIERQQIIQQRNGRQENHERRRHRRNMEILASTRTQNSTGEQQNGSAETETIINEQTQRDRRIREELTQVISSIQGGQSRDDVPDTVIEVLSEPNIPDTPSRAAGLAALRRHNQTGIMRGDPTESPMDSNSEEITEICSICQDTVDINTNNAISCGHYFHTDCLMQWRQSGRSLATTCPVCRSNIE